MEWGLRRLPLRLAFLLSSAALLVWPRVTLGQFPGQTLGGASGQIMVRVHEPDGSPFGRSAMVTVRSPSQLTNATVPTTDAVQALFTGLHAGEYLVEVRAPRYHDAQAQAIIAADKETEKEAAGTRVEELVKNVDQFTATQEMEHESLTPLGVRLSKESRSFNYLVAIRKTGARGLDVQEYRDGSVSTQPFPAHLAILGLPMLALVFHSDFRDEYEFKCEGRGKWRGRPAWVVHFRQKDGEMSEMRVYRVSGMSFPVHLKGRAWIDAENSQILAMEADMIRTVPKSGWFATTR
jgi:hypothetical protein